MSNIEQRLSLLETKASNSKPVNLLDALASIVGDESLPIYSPLAGKLVKISVQEFLNASGITELSYNVINTNVVIEFDGTTYSINPLQSIPNVTVNAGQLVFINAIILNTQTNTLSDSLIQVLKPSGNYQFIPLLNSGDILIIKEFEADPNQANTVTYTVADLNEINTSDPALHFTDTSLIYFVELAGTLYRFVGINGLYGLGELQMDMNDLLLVSNPSNVVIDTQLSATSPNPVRNSAIGTEFERTNNKFLELASQNVTQTAALALNYGFVRSQVGNNTMLLPATQVFDYNVIGYVEADTLTIDTTGSPYTLIAPNGITVNAGEHFRLQSLKAGTMLLTKFNLGSGVGVGNLQQVLDNGAIYDGENPVLILNSVEDWGVYIDGEVIEFTNGLGTNTGGNTQITPESLAIGNGSFLGTLLSTLLTATRNYQLPDKDGTFAMLSDILVEDGNKGDITVSSGGMVWTINTAAISTSMIQNSAITTPLIFNDAVTFAKLQNLTAHTLLGRAGSGNGDANEIGLNPDTVAARVGSGNIVATKVVESLLSSALQDKLNITTQNVTVTTNVNTSALTNGRRIVIDNGINDVTVTVDTDTTDLTFEKTGSGTVDFVAASGQTLNAYLNIVQLVNTYDFAYLGSVASQDHRLRINVLE